MCGFSRTCGPLTLVYIGSRLTDEVDGWLVISVALVSKKADKDNIASNELLLQDLYKLLF